MTSMQGEDFFLVPPFLRTSALGEIWNAWSMFLAFIIKCMLDDNLRVRLAA